MRKFKVTASSNSSTLKVTPYVINKGQSGEYYGLKNAEDNQVLTSAPNNWKSKKGAIAWAKKKGYEVVESACGKKSVRANTAKRRKSVKASSPNGYSRDERFALAGEVLYRAGVANQEHGAGIAYYLPGNYVLTFNSENDQMQSPDLIFTIWNPNAKDEFDYAGILYTDIASAESGTDATEALYSKGAGSLGERKEFSDFKKALDWVISKAMSKSDVNSSKKFGVKASKSARRRKAIKADWGYEESYENNYYDESPEDLKQQFDKDNELKDRLWDNWLYSFERLHPSEKYVSYESYPDVDEAVGYTREDIEYKPNAIKAASGKLVNEDFVTKEFVSRANDPVLDRAYDRSNLTVVLVNGSDLRITAEGPNRVTIREHAEAAAKKYFSEYNLFDKAKYSDVPRDVTAAWYEGGDIVMYFNGEKIYEGQPGADMYDAILPLCQDDGTRLKFQEWCNQFGDPLFDDEYGDASETAYTFCELIYYDFVDDENNYEDGNGILDFEIFPATEEVTGAKSVKCASENISAAEYNQMLADMTLGILHDDGYKGIGCAVTDEALSFYDGTEDDVVYIQPTDVITPILGDEDADAEELAAAVKSVAGKAVEATTYEDLEPINGDDSKYGYTSNGDPIDESTVDELYRIAEREVLPTTELAKVDEYATIMEDTFEYYASSPYVGVTYTISATFDTDDIDIDSYVLPDATWYYSFRAGKEVGELEFYIYVKSSEIDKVELIWNSSNLNPNNYDMEAIEEYVKGIAKPAAEAIYNAITNI